MKFSILLGIIWVLILFVPACNTSSLSNDSELNAILNYKYYDRNTSDVNPIMILLHGYNSNAERFNYWLDNKKVNMDFIAPEAPFFNNKNEFNWYHVDFINDTVGPFDTLQAQNSINKLKDFIRVLDKKTDRSILVFGISQGGTMAINLLIGDECPVDGVVALNCTLGNDHVSKSSLAPNAYKVPVFVSGSRFDKKVPLKRNRKISRLFQDSHYFMYEEFDSGHNVSPSAYKAIHRFLKAYFIY